MNTLQDRLREEARLPLEATDQAFRALDPKKPTDLAICLATHRDVFTAMATFDEDGPVVDPLLRRITADLAALGLDLPAHTVPLPDRDHRLARAYVRHATRMVTRLLARRWQDGGPADAGSYFATTLVPDPARATLTELETRDALDSDAPDILIGTKKWFAAIQDTARIHARCTDKW